MDLIKGGAIIGVIIGFWDKIKTFLWMILSSFIQKSEIKTEDIHNQVIGYLITNHKYFKSYDKVFSSQYESYRNGKYGLIAFEKFGDKMMIFLSNKRIFFGLFRVPFIFSKNSVLKGKEDSSDSKDTNKIYSSILSIRGTLNLDEIIKDSIEIRNRISWNFEERKEKSNRFNIYYFPERKVSNSQSKNENHYGYGYSWFRQNQYKLLGVKEKELGKEIKSKRNSLESLYFPYEVKGLINLISIWLESKNWYKEKNIPWKRGWLLYGIPGTGKTALARAFAEDLDLPIYVYSLAHMSNDDLVNAWQSMQLNVPCIALIEDIDNVFHKRKNIAQSAFMMQNNMFQFHKNNNSESNENEPKTPLTFDTLINCIDGVDKTDGVFTIITTNDITKVDQAIGEPKTSENDNPFVSSRPGRIDRVIELTFMTNENKVKMAQKILSNFPKKLSLIYNHIEKEIDETPAQFQELCTQIALEEYWKQKNSLINTNFKKNHRNGKLIKNLRN